MRMDEKWHQASLRILSRSLRCADITARLDATPTKCFEKGSGLRESQLSGPKREESLWIFESQLSNDKTLEQHINYLLEFIQRKTSPLAQLNGECELEIFCGFASGGGQGSVTLSSDLLKALTVIPIDLVLDLYPPTT
jgi:hypothetical protein